MSEVEIHEVDPFDDAAYDAWHAAYAAGEEADREDDTMTWSLEESRAEVQQASDVVRRHAYVGSLDGRVVAAGFLGLPLKDNRHRASLGVFTVPRARRLGVGSALLAQIEGEARAAGRTVFNVESAWRYALGADGAGAPGREFARRRGYDLALVDVRRRLDLPVPDELLDELAAGAAARHQGYTLRSWVGPVPDDLVEGWATLEASLETEAPMGELALEPAKADVASVRESEELVARQGRTKYNTVALDPDGTVVAYTDIAVTAHQSLAFQWGTLVRSADRGHRLGLAVKVANLRLLQRERPDVTGISTWNADSNVHMVEVNELLGYLPVELLGEFQKRVEG